MRRRFLGAVLLVAVVTLALYAVPRTIVVDDLVRDGERRALEGEALLIAKAIDHRTKVGGVIDDAVVSDLVSADQDVTVELADGTRAASPALRGPTLFTTAALPDGGEIRLRVAASSVDGRVTDALSSVLVFAGVALVAALGLALALSRRVVRPFTALAEHAAELGAEIHDPAPRSGLPEADRIASALDQSRDRLAQLLTDEREFSANASHQLRTPLAALRLRLEDLTLWNETDPAVRTELGHAIEEADRLSGTISDLLSLARRGGLGSAVEVEMGDAVADVAGRWRLAFEATDRRLAVRATSDVLVPTSPGAVQQILDVLFENALVHGRGDVEVVVREEGRGCVVTVADHGTIDQEVAAELFERTRRSAASAGEGIGLALARTLAGAVGARLRLASTAPTMFELAFSRRTS